MPSTLRDCMVAEDGHTFICLDASQIELRVLAILSQDPAMLQDLKTGDLHMATAVRMYGHTEDPVEMKKRRYKAKTGNFATVYGAGSYQLSITFECSEEEAQAFMDEHKRAYPRLYKWMDEVKAKAKEDGYVRTMFGRIRPLPELQDRSWKVREKAEKECVNTVVQGTAIDIVKKQMLYMRSILDLHIRLVLNVHDEQVWECPDGLLPTALEQCRELDLAFPDYPCSCKIGKIYGQVEDAET